MIIETYSVPDSETILKTMQVFKEVIAHSALCSSIPPSFPTNPALPETHLSVLISLHSHLHSTISRMEAIQQQTLSHLQQELQEIKTCMMSLPWKTFNTFSQIIPSDTNLISLELPTTSSSSPYSLFIKKSPSPLLHTSAKKQKITTFTEESAIHIKETFFPKNKNYFVALMFIKKNNSVIITYRKKISSSYSFSMFLKQVHQAIHTCVHYKCARYIPEILHQQSSNTLDLFKALYASIVRNHYFFVKNHGSLSTNTQQEIDSLLNLLNHKYYAALQEKVPDFLEEADDDAHHLDLKTFTETPPQPILNKFNFAWYMLKKQSTSKSFWITHTFISFDKFQQLKSILENARKMLNHIEKARQETSLWIDCNDGSVKLTHLPKHPITSHQGFQILQTIIAYNKQCFNEHIALLEREMPKTFWKESPFYKKTVKTLNKTDKCLCAWKDSLKLQYSNIPLPEPAHTTQEVDFLRPSQDTSFSQKNPIFIKIVPNTSFNSFAIHPCKRPIIKNFKSFCKIAKDMINSSSYLCQKVINEDIPISSNNPLVITKTLLTVLCICAFGYHQKTASSKKMSALTPDLTHSLFDTLKALDQKYCQLSDNPYDPSLDVYHPDLQAIITRGNILSLIPTQPPSYSFTYTFLSISFKKLHFSTLEKTYSHYRISNLLQLIYDQLCYPLRDIIKLILSSEIFTLKGTFSEPFSIKLLRTEGITSSKRFSRYETLILCLKILEKFQTQILTDAIFQETSDICSNIQKNLSITLTWLNAYIAHQPLPTTPLPADLYSLPITVMQVSKETDYTYQISHINLWFQKKSSRLENLKTCAKTTYKWLSYLFNPPLQSKKKIIYQGQTFLNFLFLVPTIYRTMEYEMLQIKKIILIALQDPLSYPSMEKPLKSSLRFLFKCQNLIATKWQELYPNTPIPTLEDLSEDIKPLLPFTSQDVELLKEDPIFLESRINLMEIFKYSNDDEEYSTSATLNQRPQIQDIEPLSAIQQKSSAITIFPLLSDDTTQLLTSLRPEQPSTSSFCKSFHKRKVSSKSSDYYTKKAKITIASSSSTEILIKENLPHSSQVSQKSPIELFTENTDDIVASDDENHFTPAAHKSSRKRKVSSKYPSYYTKTARTAVTSSSVKETFIEKNLSSLSPVSQRSSIELFTEDTDDIIASDDEEYFTPIASVIPISEQKQSSIKDEKLLISTKKQKIAPSIEKSEMLIKEAFLPIIQAPSSTNKTYFVALMFITKDNSVIITYRKNISSIYNFLIFLKQVQQSIHTCVHYKCVKYIPEIPQQHSSNTLDLLKALYASIVRNHYFFVKNHGSLSTNIQQEVDSLLNLLNHKYYAALQKEDPDFLEEADNCSHHVDLKTFTETPPQPILNEFNFAWYMLKKQSNSKSFWITHNLISFDQFQQLRSILANAKNMLNHVKEARQKTSLWIDCNDGSVSLPHLPKQPITSHQGFQILQTIIAYNRKCFNEHIALLEREMPDTFWKESPFYKETVKTLDKTNKCLCAWKNSLKLQYSNISLPKTAHTMTSISIETTQKDNSQEPSQDISFVQTNPIFIKIVPNNSFNNFTIRLCKRPMINNFKSSCKIAKNLLDSSSYICQEIISEDIPISSNNPLVITKTLFTALCISAFGYHQKTASSKAMSTLTPDLIDSLFDSLKALDQKYCQISNSLYDPSPEIYHPDLQTIITRGNIRSLVTIQPTTYSFTYTFMSISFKKLLFSTLERTYKHNHPRHLLQLIYDQLCHPLRDIIKLILSSEISTLTGTISELSSLVLLRAEGITASKHFTRHETLILCRKILEKLQAQILTDALFRTQSDVCYSIYIQNNLSITLTWLNAHIAHQSLPTTPLPSDLYSLPITVIQISKQAPHIYQISCPKLWFQEKSSPLDRFKTCSKMTYKWLFYLFNHPLQSKEKIIYQDQTYLDFWPLVPMIYRTVEYEMLQIKKIILVAIQRSLFHSSIQKPLKNGFRLLLKCQNLIESKWQELHPNTPIPTLEDLPEDIRPFLPFTLQDVELLKEDSIFSESEINLMEILKYSDESDQEKVPSSEDTTPETSFK